MKAEDKYAKGKNSQPERIYIFNNRKRKLAKF